MEKFALVTGGGVGIGKASALKLAAAGWHVAVTGRRREPLEAAAREIERHGRRALAIPCDIGDPAQVRALFETVGATFGRLDLLFNNAGVSAPGVPMDELTYEQWRTVVDANLTGAFLCAQGAMRLMKAQTPQGGRIRLLEPRAPRPDLRFEAVKKLRAAGLTAGILCSPLLPGITDSEVAIDAMAERAKEAEASFFAAQPLFLKTCSRPTFFRFVEEHFPELKGDYAAQFAKDDFAKGPYKKELAERVARICRKYGLAARSSDALLTRDVGVARRPVANVGAVVQRRLFG